MMPEPPDLERQERGWITPGRGQDRQWLCTPKANPLLWPDLPSQVSIDFCQPGLEQVQVDRQDWAAQVHQVSVRFVLYAQP